MGKNLTDEFIAYLKKKEKRITKTILDRARLCLLDYIGVTHAGAYANRDIFNEKYSGDCSLIGLDSKADMKTAAMINAFNAHTAELDDGHRRGMIHLGAVIVSAVTAAADRYGLDMPDISKGIIMGYEAAVRAAMAIQPSHKKKGFHTTGTCGAVGAAVGIAFSRGYNEKQLKSTISAAATSAAGLLEIQEDDSELKPYNAAHAAMAGAAAAELGVLGLPGPDDILAGARGMFRLLADEVNAERMVEDTDYFEIEKIYVKPYAACRHCHSAMEAAIYLKNEYDLPPEDIKSIDIYTYKLAIRGHDHKEIKGVSSAKLSMPYSVAAAYILGSGGLEAFSSDKLERADINALINKINIYEKDEFNNVKNGERIAEVVMTAKDGSAQKKRVDYAKGDPENSMTEEDIIDKFKMLMDRSGRSDKTESTLNEILYER
ncbi:MAG: MmgE/PrpD family protein [Clostridia bacterium]|nr:MmgE/PrpD family protein [Clostridia bacterium]